MHVRADSTTDDLVARFDRAAPRYESWYETRRGARTAGVERRLLASLLGSGPSGKSVLEVGCGTGYFTEWLDERYGRAVGLDYSAEMLREIRRHGRTFPVVRGDANRLPFESESFDTVAFITTLEFLDEPQLALQEAARVARREIILLWLNPFSVAALRRMRTPGPLLSQVRPLTAREVRMMLLGCGAGRVDGISWASALFPWPFSRLCARIPLGDVLAMKLSLTPSARGEGSGGR
jgi:ubiquinone/menaquinone biosynthesis C-methylase UbiE